jgi:hypothetical protein
MTRRRAGTWIGAAAGLLAALAPATAARACFDERKGTGLAIQTAPLPSEVGVAVPAGDPSSRKLVVGWSWQIPVTLDGVPFHNRVVGGVDLLARSDGASGRGRLGYRYAGRHAFAGLGFGVDGAGPNLSPEVGLKFLHADGETECVFDPSLHLLVRAEIEPEKAHLRGATVLLGWNLL